MPKQIQSTKGNPAAKRMNNPTLKFKRIRNRDRNERIQETTGFRSLSRMRGHRRAHKRSVKRDAK